MVTGCEEVEEQCSVEEQPSRGCSSCCPGRPAGGPGLQSVSYDAQSGKAFPTGIKDFAPVQALKDMTSLPGAPKHEESLSATVEPTPFFDSTSFYPHVGSGADTRASKQLDEYREKLNPIVSGHDHELPGQVPWKVFMFGTMLLGSVWILAAIYQLLDANNLMTWFTRFGIQTFDSGAQVHPVDPLQQHMTSLLQSWSVSQA